MSLINSKVGLELLGQLKVFVSAANTQTDLNTKVASKEWLALNYQQLLKAAKLAGEQPGNEHRREWRRQELCIF